MDNRTSSASFETDQSNPYPHSLGARRRRGRGWTCLNYLLLFREFFELVWSYGLVSDIRPLGKYRSGRSIRSRKTGLRLLDRATLSSARSGFCCLGQNQNKFIFYLVFALLPILLYSLA